jgi:hypothetical protein
MVLRAKKISNQQLSSQRTNPKVER